MVLLSRPHTLCTLAFNASEKLLRIESTPSIHFPSLLLWRLYCEQNKSPFSAKALDHAHEQCNATVKGDGGAVRLTNNPAALKRWVTAGPEIARLVSSFEHQLLLSQDRLKDHHEQIPSVQNAFTRDVDALVSAFEEGGNPFEDDGECLFALDTKDIVEEVSATTVQNVLAKGEHQFNNFTTDRLVQRTKPITDPVDRNRNHLFSRPKKAHRAASVLKSGCSLFFSRLYIACQSRQGDMKEFFSHENHAFLPSLSNLEEMHAGKKSDLLTCLDQKLCYTEHVCSLEQTCSTYSTPDTIPDENVPTEDLVVFDNMLEADLVQVRSEMVLDDTSFPSQGTTDQSAKILDGACMSRYFLLNCSRHFKTTLMMCSCHISCSS